MPATAENLRDLHQLHQRAKALRDRLTSGPKTLAARQAALANRQAALEAARKALQDAKVQLKKHEHSLQGHQAKIDDLKVKLNQVKKNEEYKAIQNQIAHDQAADRASSRTRSSRPWSGSRRRPPTLAAEEAEVKKFAAEVAALKEQVESQAGRPAGRSSRSSRPPSSRPRTIIPEDLRERYRRTVKQHGADAMAPVEQRRLLGLLRLRHRPDDERADQRPTTLTFCKTCGRILYLAEEDVLPTRRTAR